MVKLIGGVIPGAEFPTTNGDIVVLEIIDNQNVRVCFVHPFFEKVAKPVHVRKGSVKNPLFPSVFDVGYIGVGLHNVSENSKATKVYNIWHSMLQRVYSPQNDTHARQYSGVSIHPDWLNFQNFADWYVKRSTQFIDVDFGWDLDKDLLFPGNRIYGPDTCCLVPHPVNGLLLGSNIARGELPIGVSRDGSAFTVKCSVFDKKGKYIGRYKTVRDAQIAYWNAKFQSIRFAAIMYWNYLPESLAMRLIQFGWEDAKAYYGDDARLWSDNERTV